MNITDEQRYRKFRMADFDTRNRLEHYMGEELDKQLDKLIIADSLVDIKSIMVTKSREYDPKLYIQYCAEFGATPTQEGFKVWTEEDIHKDFGQHQPLCDLTIKTINPKEYSAFGKTFRVTE